MTKANNTVYFVGSGPGDPDLITLKALKLLQDADVVVYSGSLLNPKLLDYVKNGAQIHDAALLDRELIFEILKKTAKSGKLAVRFHDGDPSLFSAIREQVDKLEKDGINCKVVPGITAVLGGSSVIKFRINPTGCYSDVDNHKSRI